MLFAEKEKVQNVLRSESLEENEFLSNMRKYSSLEEENHLEAHYELKSIQM